MKKIVSYTCLLLITLVIGFGFLNNVYAACEGMDYNTCRTVSSGRGQIVVGGDGSGLYASGVTRTNKWSEDYTYSSIGVTAYFKRNGTFIYSGYREDYSRLFCLDAQYVGTNPLYASRFLLNTNSDITIQAMDIALLSILTGNGGTGGLVSSTRGADYWARLLAMRAIVATFGMHNSASGTYNSAYYAGLTATNTFLSHSSTAQARNELVSALAALGKTITPTDSFSAYPNYYFRGTPVNTAEAYYVAALKDATEYVKNYSEGAQVDPNSVLPVSTEVETTEDSAGTMVSKDVTHTIIVSGLPKNDTNSFSIDSITLDHEYVGLDYYIKSIKIGDDLLETSNGGQDLAQFLGVNLLGGGSTWDFTEETKIEITVHFEGFVESDVYDELQCGDSEIKYSINGSYSSEIQNKYSGYVATIWYSGTSKKQRYLGIETAGENQANPGASTWTSPYTTRLIDACDCDDLIEACKETGSMSSDECQELLEADCGECAELEVECEFGDQDACDKYGEVCEVECTTTVDTFNCCDADNNLIISPSDDWEVNIKGPEDVYACFVSQIDNQVDLAGENVGAENVAGAVDDVGNSYTLDQNRYCVVSCKEDYMMTMPTAKLVNAGRYFTFKAAVDGEKTCYTNKIDRDLYEKDIQAAQIRLVKAFNEWLRVYTASQTEIEEVERNCCSACGGTYYNYYLDSTSPYSYSYTIGSDGRITISRTSGLDYSDSSTGGSSCPCTSYSCGKNGTSCCGRDCSYCESGDKSDIEKRLAKALSDAETELSNAQTNYENIIKEYNKCSEWETEIEYDSDNPEVYYDYEESYLDDFYNGYGEMDASLSGKNTSEWYCNSNVSSNGAETQAKLDGNAYDSCTMSTTSSTKYTSINYVYCDKSGCEMRSEDISDARYKKVTSTIEADYIPATLFYNIYPTGEITDEEVDNSVALENGLPVSLNTARGIYKYTVNMSSLGEFYDLGSLFDGNSENGDPGRLIAGSREDNAVINKNDYTDFVDENGTVQYACSYLVNMGITDGDTIVCDFDTECTGDDCIADCIGPNCDYECTGDDCIADCIGAGCIYDNDAGTSLIERVVSLNNLFPNGTNSYNWNREATEKAATTVYEIEDAGNSVYDEDPILSVTITPSVARAIKQYNDDAEGDGGYSNSTLSCYSLDGYERIACYSSFITGLLDGHIEYDGVDYINNVDVVNERSLIMGNNYRTVSDNNTEYFTSWNSGISEEDMIGPSWK